VFQACSDREEAMADANYLRERARRCRALAHVTTDPEVIYQLQVWAMEFDRDAEAAEGGRPAEEEEPDTF
jgi:hypothetical protein